MYPTPTLNPTQQAAQEQLERLLLGGPTMQEFSAITVLIAVGSIALLIVFWTWVYLNRNAIRRWLRNYLLKD